MPHDSQPQADNSTRRQLTEALAARLRDPQQDIGQLGITFGGLRFVGTEGLSKEDRRAYLRVMYRYVARQRNHPGYEWLHRNPAVQALKIEADLRALVQGRILALAPQPEIVEQARSLAYTVRHLTSSELALDLALNRVVSRSIAKVLDAAPALVPMAIAVLVAKDVVGALNEASLSEQEKAQQIEEEHRHDREWQSVQIDQHEYERDR